MDTFAQLLLRMVHWARHPPSWQHLIFVAVVLVVAFGIAGIEHLFGWPDWLTVNRLPRNPMR